MISEEYVDAITCYGPTKALRRTFEDGHRIYIFNFGDGKREVPGVTSVIRRVFKDPFPQAAAAAMEHGRERGNEVHRAVALLSGIDPLLTLDWDTLDPEVEPRVRCFDAMKTKTNWHPVHVETAFVSFQYGFAGTADQVGYFVESSHGAYNEATELHVADVKPPSAWFVRLQLSAYAIAIKESLKLPRMPKRMPIYLSDDKPARHPVLDKPARDRTRWLTVMSTYHIGIEEGVWK